MSSTVTGFKAALLWGSHNAKLLDEQKELHSLASC